MAGPSSIACRSGRHGVETSFSAEEEPPGQVAPDDLPAAHSREPRVSARASVRRWSRTAEAAANTPAIPRLPNAQPQALVPAAVPPRQSRIAPNIRGATAPEPYPTSDRRPSAAPRYAGGTTSVIAVE